MRVLFSTTMCLHPPPSLDGCSMHRQRSTYCMYVYLQVRPIVNKDYEHQSFRDGLQHFYDSIHQLLPSGLVQGGFTRASRDDFLAFVFGPRVCFRLQLFFVFMRPTPISKQCITYLLAATLRLSWKFLGAFTVGGGCVRARK